MKYDDESLEISAYANGCIQCRRYIHLASKFHTLLDLIKSQ